MSSWILVFINNDNLSYFDLAIQPGINGSVVFTKASMGQSYIFRVVARDIYMRRFVLRGQVNVFGKSLSN